MASPQETSAKLRICIIEARDLAAKDRNGFSDPYAVLTINDEMHQTQVVPRDLNPVWNATFDYTLPTHNLPVEFHLTCWDKDMFGKDYLGEAKVDLTQLWRGESVSIGYNDPGNKPKWYPLSNASRPKDSSVKGDIHVKVGLINEENLSIESKEWVTVLQGISNLSSSDQEKPPLPPRPPAEAKTGERKTSSNFLGITFLEVLRAEELPPEKNAARTGFDMDPFVVISFAKHTFRTRIIPHSLNPIWNEKLYFPVEKNETNYSIKLSVYDWDKFTTNDLIGICHFRIRELIQNSASRNNTYLQKSIEESMNDYIVPLELKTKDNYDLSPKLYLRAQFAPYDQLRRHFWFALAKVYDSDDNGVLNIVEISTMLNSLGSSLTDKSIDAFFTRFNKDPVADGLTFEELATYLEERLNDDKGSMISITPLGEEKDTEHLVFISECPICHKPDLSYLPEADVITHIAICASTDWANVSKFVVGDFVTESQAQRKWLANVIVKLGYGSFKIGANNANIIVQDRMTGQLVEEKMPTYIRLGIRLLYRRRGQVEAKTTRNLLETLSVKQGKKFSVPSSVNDIEPFIAFHELNVDEILDPRDSFKNFNEFFYRKLKPSARKLDSPNDPRVLVSPADCRMMAFPTVTEATMIWIKGQSFSIERLLGDPKAAAQFEEGSLGIFRLAPQDYHRYHFPVDGVLSKPHDIPGAYYTVNPMAIRSELDVYGENKRSVSYIDSKEFGKVAYVAIGAMMVGSIVFTSKHDSFVKRFAEHGYFAFGGSTIVLLFEKGRMVWDKDLLENSEQALETLVRVGMHVGRAVSE